MADEAAHLEDRTNDSTSPSVQQEPCPAVVAANATAAAATHTPTAVDIPHPLVADDQEDEDEDGPGVFNDGDSGFESGRSVDWTVSLASSIRNYREMFGRTYHSFKEGKYHAPNDEREQNRLDLQNHLYMLTLGGKLHLAPIPKDIHTCLDVGTGTGLWATDFADMYPNCKVIGIDLSPIQATWIPPNVEFVVDDAEEPWAFPEKFDLIHSRMMVGSFADWPKYFASAYEALKPGGWIEVQDVGDLVSDSQDISETGIDQWYRTALKAFRVAGREVKITHLFKQMVKDAGFEEVQEVIFKWPLNTWPADKHMKELGMWSRENILDSVEAWSIVPFTQFLGMSVEQTQVYQARARTALRDTSIHAYWRVHIIYGRKPLTQGSSPSNP